ncbi:MAG: TatD family hydrolase [Opitutales bacterium]|nr:TatD family hydrolase [Opitutales bacterium]
MPAPATDAHCHIPRGFFADARGGAEICVSACFPGEWETLEKLGGVSIKKAYGLHPAFADKGFCAEDFHELLLRLRGFLPKADAVGETGLDANCGVSIETQAEVFRAQLGFAKEFGLPAVVHCVGKWGMAAEIISESFRGGWKFLLHAASCSAEIAKRMLKLGGYFSFGPRELSSRGGLRCLSCVPENRILAETDGASTEGARRAVLEKLATVLGKEPEPLAERVYKNFTEFYSK